MTSDDWRPLAADLAATLTAAGVLTEQWRNAFTHTPRHQFVPYFRLHGREYQDSPDLEQRRAWLHAAYRDEPLITQQRADAAGEAPTSSSTCPSLMATMLDLLKTSGGDRVLEIGTGTGYNTAILCHHLGCEYVTSIDLDPTLISQARHRLTDLHRFPSLIVGDGAAGVPTRVPYDRILSTAAVAAIPPAWIDQLNHRGRLVTDYRGNLTSSLLVAHKSDANTVTGRFVGTPGHFMWLRPRLEHPGRLGTDPGFVIDFNNPSTTTTTIPPQLFTNPHFLFWLQLAVPHLLPISDTIRDNRPGLFLLTETDRSWVEITPPVNGRATVNSGGPQALWQAVLQAWHSWNDHDQPAIDRLGITTTIDGCSTLWIDTPDDTVRIISQGARQ
ncbi:protein-L-isoaspartate O-methyltransferase [Pilimelia anulata]|uniref:Protein-L-isoaspartate O-methyltransferase n=1 Tax=Pilimelia anulata TaxID=53371 RepID=A0A8J3F751_9ACTN|nr:methyltransferase domain-containing protein [Pilimelia anulata]GGJ75369.1 protein-L-isoaspartate O-methyltransferase [Pilimelia anulata]